MDGMNGHGQKLLERMEIAGNGWIWIKMAGNGLTQLEMVKIIGLDENYWKLLEMVEMTLNGLKWLKMAIMAGTYVGWSTEPRKTL